MLSRQELGRRVGLANKTHGESRGTSVTPEYRAWHGMHSRCGNSNDKDHANYGARGIEVCARWDFYEAFLQDMGRKPSAKHSLDRIDPNGNYEPSNCRWADITSQNNNRRNTLFVEYSGTRMPLGDAIRAAGSIVKASLAHTRITRLGWTAADAVEIPAGPRGDKSKRTETA